MLLQRLLLLHGLMLVSSVCFPCCFSVVSALVSCSFCIAMHWVFFQGCFIFPFVSILGTAFSFPERIPLCLWGFQVILLCSPWLFFPYSLFPFPVFSWLWFALWLLLVCWPCIAVKFWFFLSIVKHWWALFSLYFARILCFAMLVYWIHWLSSCISRPRFALLCSPSLFCNFSFVFCCSEAFLFALHCLCFLFVGSLSFLLLSLRDLVPCCKHSFPVQSMFLGFAFSCSFAFHSLPCLALPPLSPYPCHSS